LHFKWDIGRFFVIFMPYLGKKFGFRRMNWGNSSSNIWHWWMPLSRRPKIRRFTRFSRKSKKSKLTKVARILI
jgi:hypothetical protein